MQPRTRQVSRRGVEMKCQCVVVVSVRPASTRNQVASVLEYSRSAMDRGLVSLVKGKDGAKQHNYDGGRGRGSRMKARR